MFKRLYMANSVTCAMQGFGAFGQIGSTGNRIEYGSAGAMREVPISEAKF
jgi:hypothetical protein